jgi:HD superfamily phosphohydrolase YqeK
MNPPIPNALANTVLLADHDEALQQQVVDAIEKIVYRYLQKNINEISANTVSYQQGTIERIALRAVKQHFINASNIY